MLDKKTKEELMKLSKEEIIEVYEMLYELYDELGDRIKQVIDYIATLDYFPYNENINFEIIKDILQVGVKK